VEQLPFPPALIEVEHGARLGEEVRVGGEDPGAMLPGLERVLLEPAGNRRGGGLADAPLDDEAMELSAREKRERGRPCALGSSQAIAFTCATSSGGKTPRSAWPRSVAKAVEALLEEALAPERDRPQCAVEAAGDLRVRLPLGGEEDDLRSQHSPCGTV
jgi:hypothetical protein